MTFPSRRWVGCGSDSTLRALRLCVRLSAPDYAACVLRSRSTGAAGIRIGLFSAGLTLSARSGFRNRLQSASLIVPGIAQRPMRVDCGSIHGGRGSRAIETDCNGLFAAVLWSVHVGRTGTNRCNRALIQIVHSLRSNGLSVRAG